MIGGGVEVLRFSGQVRFMRGIRQIGKNFDVANSVDFRVEGHCGAVRVPFELGKPTPRASPGPATASARRHGGWTTSGVGENRRRL